jgi:hypothetical protein
VDSLEFAMQSGAGETGRPAERVHKVSDEIVR